MTPHEIVNRYELLRGERKNWDYQAELIERFIMPGRGRFFQEGFDGEESVNWRHRELYDQTAPQLAILLASNVQSGIMNPGTQWFEPRTDQAASNDDHEVREWLDECGTLMHRSLNGSNLQVESHDLILDAVGFSTAVQIHEEERENERINSFNGHIFTTPMAREIYFEEDWYGRPLGLWRRRSYTPLQLIDKFGRDVVPQSVRDMADGDKANEKMDVVWAVYPRRDDWRDVDVSNYLSPQARPWEAKYILYESHEQLGPTYGYHECPGYVVRWSKTAGSKFGHGPGLVTLSDVLSLNQLRELLHETTEKVTDPPLRATQRGIIGDLETMAGGLTVTRTDNAVGPLVDPRFYRVEVGFKDLEDLREGIRQAFFVDQLQLKDSPQMTATEVRARMDLMHRFLGPVVTRLKEDYLDPLVNRTFWMMHRKRALPPPPRSMKNVMYDIEYRGPLARAQRLGDVESIERMIVAAASMAEVKPEVMDRIDFDEAIDHMAEVLGVPAKVLRSDSEVGRLRRQTQAKQRTAETIGAAQGVASAAKDAAAAQELLAATPGVGGIQ